MIGSALMKRPLILLLLASLAGCVGTAHRKVSEGTIDSAAPWKIDYGGYAGSHYTALRTRGFHIGVKSFNEGPRRSALLLPVPLPLGTTRPIASESYFVIGIFVWPEDPSIDLRFDPGKTELETPRGEILGATGAMQLRGREACTEQPQNLPSKVWFTKDGFDAIHISQPTCFLVMFEVPTPSTAERFAVTIRGLYSEKREIQVPRISFKEASAWGGW